MCRDTSSWGGGDFTSWPAIVTKTKKVPGNTVAKSLQVWLLFDQLSCKFENVGGCDAPGPPVGSSLVGWPPIVEF